MLTRFNLFLRILWIVFSLNLIGIGSNLISLDKENNLVPVVFWHGMGDTCCFPFSLGLLKNIIEKEIGAYVKSLEIGNNIINDYRSGFFIHPNKQVKEACELIKSDPKLVNGFNAIGFSQGGQFLRALAQRCPEINMQTLITIGGQHQGIFGLPKCLSISGNSCEYIRKLLNNAAYESWVQKLLVQATYWHDPLNEGLYQNKSTFLNDINNEKEINENYNINLQKLRKFVMVKFLNDTIVQPKESQWFEFYKPGQDQVIQPLTESSLYLEDKLGLRQMDMDGKIEFLATEGDHLQFSRKWFIDTIIPYLRY